MQNESSSRNLVAIVAILILGVGILAAAGGYVSQERQKTAAANQGSKEASKSAEKGSDLAPLGQQGENSSQKQSSFNVDAKKLPLEPLIFGAP